jgi:tripartite-type tricarboxylate transporter receptor subunit TctC
VAEQAGPHRRAVRARRHHRHPRPRAGARAGKAFGQTFIVENKPGAGGNTGADLVAKSPPDGYTLLMGTVGTQSINPSLYPKMPYDAVKDFAPITLFAGVPNVLVINPAKARR